MKAQRTSSRMVSALDIEEEGISHINTHWCSKFDSGRKLCPIFSGIEIDSVLGFTYRRMIAPVGNLKIKSAEHFDNMMLCKDGNEANVYYEEHKDTISTIKVYHFFSIIYVLYLERALLDVKFREALISTGRLPIVCYRKERYTHEGSHMYTAKPLLFNNYIPFILESVRNTLTTDNYSKIEEFNNDTYKDTSWIRSIPTYRNASQRIVAEVEGRVNDEILTPLDDLILELKAT